MSGTVGSVSVAGTDREFLALCDVAADGTSVPFLRRFSVTPTGTVSATDTELDGTTAYTVTGTANVCLPEPAEPVDVEAHGVQDTGWSLAANPGTQSVSLLVYAGTVSVTTEEGTLTVPAGAALSWSVDGDEVDAQLTGTLTVAGTAPAASWHVIWTAQA
ncbi:hypothetical protein ACIQMV_38305 [Streptomyces sp. NPDC091412]|uniref:hypothetical protein n=1 Tax=Streptomyces sp. NPDC091412 TaxID=3366002 RepID=UPI0037F62226